jgi:hypothetical protein
MRNRRECPDLRVSSGSKSGRWALSPELKKAANCRPENLSQWRTQQAEDQGAGNQEGK